MKFKFYMFLFNAKQLGNSIFYICLYVIGSTYVKCTNKHLH